MFEKEKAFSGIMEEERRKEREEEEKKREEEERQRKEEKEIRDRELTVTFGFLHSNDE